jgi:hypothetical protein
VVSAEYKEPGAAPLGERTPHGAAALARAVRR